MALLSQPTINRAGETADTGYNREIRGEGRTEFDQEIPNGATAPNRQHRAGVRRMVDGSGHNDAANKVEIAGSEHVFIDLADYRVGLASCGGLPGGQNRADVQNG